MASLCDPLERGAAQGAEDPRRLVELRFERRPVAAARGVVRAVVQCVGESDGVPDLSGHRFGFVVECFHLVEERCGPVDEHPAAREHERERVGITGFARERERLAGEPHAPLDLRPELQLNREREHQARSYRRRRVAECLERFLVEADELGVDARAAQGAGHDQRGAREPVGIVHGAGTGGGGEHRVSATLVARVP